MRSYKDKAKMMYERKMDEVHHKVEKAKDYAMTVEDFLDVYLSEKEKEKIEPWMMKLIRTLDDIC